MQRIKFQINFSGLFNIPTEVCFFKKKSFNIPQIIQVSKTCFVKRISTLTQNFLEDLPLFVLLKNRNLKIIIKGKKICIHFQNLFSFPIYSNEKKKQNFHGNFIALQIYLCFANEREDNNLQKLHQQKRIALMGGGETFHLLLHTKFLYFPFYKEISSETECRERGKNTLKD